MKHNRKMSEATKRAGALYLHALEGSRSAQHRLAESIATGDFAYPIAPLLQAQIVKVYHEQDNAAAQFTTQKLVSGIDRDEQVQVLVIDSDQSNIPGVNMGDTWIPGTLPRVGPREAYPQIGLFPAYGKTIRASKIGEAFGIDWEAIVNSNGGEVDLIDNAINSFGIHAANTEDADVAKLLVNPAGFSAALQAAGKHIPGNPDFSDVIAFADALQTFQETPVVIDGNPIYYSDYTLLCDPSQVYKYNRMIAVRAITQVPARTGADSENAAIEYQFDVNIPVNITVVGWRWLKKVYPNIGKGYILIPNGSTGGPANSGTNAGANQYPVLTSNFLRGYLEPSFWVKDSNASVAGGGGGAEIDVLTNGDFDSDAIETKVRHVHGASMLWGDGILYSDGSNT